jgi:hypothetical protein
MTFRNEGASDRLTRLVLALALGYAAWVTWPATVGVAFAVIAALALFTGLVGWCPAYTLFGFSTTKKVRVAP